MKKSFENTYRIGIDLGGTNIVAGVVDHRYKIVSKYSVPTNRYRDYNEIIKDMAETVYEALKEVGIGLEQCVNVGIGSPGICNGQTGEVIYSNNIPWNHVPIAKELKKYIPLPCSLSNDANCAALGEVLAGSASRCSNAVMFTLGTGVGSGIIIDKKIYAGKYSAGAELGHTTIMYNGKPCSCGRKGCFETYASASAFLEQAIVAKKKNSKSMLSQRLSENLTCEYVFECANKGDRVAIKVIDQYMEYISEGIANAVNIFRPEMVILGGGICNAGDVFVEEINRRSYIKYFGAALIPVPKVVRATLGNDAGIIGAAYCDMN